MMKMLGNGLLALSNKAVGRALAAFGLVLVLYACQDKTAEDLNETSSAAESDMRVIAGTFAKALESSDLRQLVKNEAGKKFDGDYDILVQMIADNEITPGKTVIQLLEQYSGGIDMRTLLRKYPLLSVYVPKLSNFDAESWDVQADAVPQVAVAQFANQRNEIRVVNAINESSWVSQTEKPAFPVIVLKENERVGIHTSDKAANGRTASIFSNGGFSYYFLDEDGGENAGNGRKGFPNSFDAKVLSAYNKSQNCANCYHRDYVYYDISPSEGVNDGPFDHHYSEAVTALQFENLTSLQAVNSNWTEGDLEFHIIAMFIGGSSTLTQLEKVYHTTSDAFYSNGQLTMNMIGSPLVLVPWEMNIYGDRWKFNVIEYDPGTTTTINTSHSTTKSTNFTYNTEIAAIVKIGSGYGSTETTTDSNSTTIATTTGSNQLGEAVHNWFDPIVISWRRSGVTIEYTTREISTGSIRLSVEPIRVNP